MQFGAELHGFPAIARLPHNFHIGLGFQDHAKALPHQGMIVREKNTDHAACGALWGTHTSILTPWPGLDVNFSSPPALRARARMPDNPIPGRTPGAKPLPLSERVKCTRPSAARSAMDTFVAPECRAIFVNASCTIRNR